jgi:hypothetical protein
MSENDNNSNSNVENVFFSLDETDNELNTDNSTQLNNLLEELNFEGETNNLTSAEITEIMSYEYKINYTVKELLLICEYYGIAKELKKNKSNKDVIIFDLVSFENIPLNNEIVLRRQGMWYYMSKLKSDNFMKKYIIW